MKKNIVNVIIGLGIFVIAVLAVLAYANIREDKTLVFDPSLSQETIDKELKVVEEGQAMVEGGKDVYEGYIQMGAAWDRLLQYEKAAEAYEDALRVNSLDYLSARSLAAAYAKIGRYDRAEQMYLRAIENGPNEVFIYEELAGFYFKYKPNDAKKIVDIVDSALAQNPDNKGFLGILVMYYRAAGDTENLKATLQQLLQIDPDNEAAKAELAELE